MTIRDIKSLMQIINKKINLGLPLNKSINSEFEKNASWRNTIEACGLTAGLVGGIGGEKCRTAAAHAIHNSITQIITPNKFLHGEIVGVGLLLQLRLEEMKNNNKLADQSIKPVSYTHLTLPTKA